MAILCGTGSTYNIIWACQVCQKQCETEQHFILACPFYTFPTKQVFKAAGVMILELKINQ